MTPYWQRFGFPFDHLVPSLATAIGSSADRPIALAELVGIILNDGVHLPTVRISKLRFARNTPYETVFEPNEPGGVRVMEPEIAQALRRALAGVAQTGTARRLAGGFTDHNGKPIPVGGKTGSGDNRYETRNSSRVVSRTGTFAFYIGDRYWASPRTLGDAASQYASPCTPVAAEVAGSLAVDPHKALNRRVARFRQCVSSNLL
jgi:membrane peptidoglycan carboxypeptidase